jgi:uncharacterized protein (DUF433 family)
MEHIDWTECALIETVPGKRGGKPVIKGTWLRPEDLLPNREQGIEWLVENHGGITPDTVAPCSISTTTTQRRGCPTWLEGPS